MNYIGGTASPPVELPPFDENAELEQLRQDREWIERAYQEQVAKVKRGERHESYWHE